MASGILTLQNDDRSVDTTRTWLPIQWKYMHCECMSCQKRTCTQVWSTN